jgi:hypothetical protein
MGMLRQGREAFLKEVPFEINPIPQPAHDWSSSASFNARSTQTSELM